MLQVLRPSRICWRPCPLPGPEYISAFLTSSFILQTYMYRHIPLWVIIHKGGSTDSDSDSNSDTFVLCHRWTAYFSHLHFGGRGQRMDKVKVWRETCEKALHKLWLYVYLLQASAGSLWGCVMEMWFVQMVMMRMICIVCVLWSTNGYSINHDDYLITKCSRNNMLALPSEMYNFSV